MRKKKLTKIMIPLLVVFVIVAGVFAYIYWPWRNLTRELQRAVGTNDVLYVDDVHRIKDGKDVTIQVDPEMASYAPLMEGLAQAKVGYLRTEENFAYDEPLYILVVSSADSRVAVRLSINKNGYVHIMPRDKTYALADDRVDLYTLAEQAFLEDYHGEDDKIWFGEKPEKD